MPRYLTRAILLVLALAAAPTTAAADVTGFLGNSSTPSGRSAKGVAIGIGLVIVGFEFEYSKIAEDESQAAGRPHHWDGQYHGDVTPTHKVQLYGTTGGGSTAKRIAISPRHNLRPTRGGVKIGWSTARLRIDYRIFNLNGLPVLKRHQQYGIESELLTRQEAGQEAAGVHPDAGARVHAIDAHQRVLQLGIDRQRPSERRHQILTGS